MNKEIDNVVVTLLGNDKFDMLQTRPFKECIDSLEFVKLLVFIEDKLDVQIGDDFLNIDEYNNLNDLKDYISTL